MRPAQNGAQWCAQFVRDGGQEFALRMAQAPGLVARTVSFAQHRVALALQLAPRGDVLRQVDEAEQFAVRVTQCRQHHRRIEGAAVLAHPVAFTGELTAAHRQRQLRRRTATGLVGRAEEVCERHADRFGLGIALHQLGPAVPRRNPPAGVEGENRVLAQAFHQGADIGIACFDLAPQRAQIIVTVRQPHAAAQVAEHNHNARCPAADGDGADCTAQLQVAARERMAGPEFQRLRLGGKNAPEWHRVGVQQRPPDLTAQPEPFHQRQGFGLEVLQRARTQHVQCCGVAALHTVQVADQHAFCQHFDGR